MAQCIWPLIVDAQSAIQPAARPNHKDKLGHTPAWDKMAPVCQDCQMSTQMVSYIALYNGMEGEEVVVPSVVVLARDPPTCGPAAIEKLVHLLRQRQGRLG